MTEATGGCVGPGRGAPLPLPPEPGRSKVVPSVWAEVTPRLRCSEMKWLRLPLVLWLHSCPWEPV